MLPHVTEEQEVKKFLRRKKYQNFRSHRQINSSIEREHAITVFVTSVFTCDFIGLLFHISMKRSLLCPRKQSVISCIEEKFSTYSAMLIQLTQQVMLHLHVILYTDDQRPRKGQFKFQHRERYIFSTQLFTLISDTTDHT